MYKYLVHHILDTIYYIPYLDPYVYAVFWAPIHSTETYPTLRTLSPTSSNQARGTVGDSRTPGFEEPLIKEWSFNHIGVLVTIEGMGLDVYMA